MRKSVSLKIMILSSSRPSIGLSRGSYGVYPTITGCTCMLRGIRDNLPVSKVYKKVGTMRGKTVSKYSYLSESPIQQQKTTKRGKTGGKVLLIINNNNLDLYSA